MAQFKFAVSGQFLDLLTPTKGISDGLFVNSFKFDFRSPEWETCAEKWVHFYNSKYSETSYDYLLDNDEIVPERGVNLPSGIWEVYVHGSVITNNEVIKRYVTENQSIQIIQSGIINAEPLSTIEPSVAEQLSALVTSAYKARITTATGSVDSGYGAPGVDVSISGEDAYKVITFDFHNIQGKGIASIVFTETGENEGLITITMDDGDEIVFDGIRDAIASITNYTEIADGYLEDTEAYATGKRNGEDVESDDPAYHNNAKYYNEQAADSAEAASDSSDSANIQALKSEGYAVGKQNDANVDSSSPYYHNNAKYYKDQAASRASAAEEAKDNSETHALEAEGYAVGKQNGTDVQSGSPYYENNAKYYMEQTAAKVNTAIPAPASPSAGQFLVYNGTAWVAQSLEEWQGGNY